MTTVVCFGTFDGLHPGHEALFRQAREHGERLCVVVARDATVMEVKDQLPGMGEQERLRRVQQHPLVQHACLGYPGDKYRIIQEIRPQVIVLGYDQQAFTERLSEELARRSLEVRIIRAVAYHPETYKSSLLKPRVDEADEPEEDLEFI